MLWALNTLLPFERGTSVSENFSAKALEHGHGLRHTASLAASLAQSGPQPFGPAMLGAWIILHPEPWLRSECLNSNFLRAPKSFGVHCIC